jgi:DNA/RNA endonuclease YhcR with UshA esterase domain
MEDQTIFRIALFSTIFGLVGMIITAGLITPQKIEIKNLNKGMIDKEVSLEGYVQSVDKSKNGATYFLELNDGTGKVKVIIFPSVSSELEQSTIKILNLNNRQINIVGKVSEYSGTLELILKDSKSLKIIN